MKKVIKTTHIDTGGHGYLSVSKKDFILAGGDPAKVSGYSGHTLTRIYLEEDCDQNYFWDVATANGFTIERKSGYNLKFAIKHNYKPELFNYVPEVGDILNNGIYKISSVTDHAIFIRHSLSGMVYRVSYYNPFEYITDVVKMENLVKSV